MNQKIAFNFLRKPTTDAVVLEICKTIELLSILNKGGSTYPWLVNLLDDKQAVSAFVVKIFTHRQIEQQNAVAKEVFGNLLAHQLSLSAPRAVLAQFTNEFVNTLTQEYRERHLECHRGPRFATLHHEGYSIFGDHLPKSKVKEYDIASIYAFDLLTQNPDRGGFRNKPNLIIQDNGGYLLIDHEQIFPFFNDPEHPNEQIISDFLKIKSSYNHQTHLFYPYLKEYKINKLEQMFAPFISSLDQLNIKHLTDTAHFLLQNGHPCGDIDTITHYLCTVKENPEKLLSILLSQLA